MTKTYTCCVCHETFEEGRSQEEATKEFRQEHGRDPDPKDGIACDDCYKKLVQSLRDSEGRLVS